MVERTFQEERRIQLLTTRIKKSALIASLCFWMILFSVGSAFMTAQATEGAITIATSWNNPATGYPFQHRMFIAQNRYWVFTTENQQDSFRSCILTNPCSSDPAQWSSLNSNGIGGSAQEGFAVWYDPTINMVFYVRSIGNNDPGGHGYLYYRYGTPNTDGSITWSSAEKFFTTTGANNIFPSIFATATNNIWITTDTQVGQAKYTEVWRLTTSWSKKFSAAGNGGTVAGQIVSLTGTQYALVTGDAAGSGDSLLVYTTGDSGSTWTSGVPAQSLFSLNEAGALSIGNTFYLAGSVPATTCGLGGQTCAKLLTCTYPCSSLSETTLAPDDNKWATIATDGIQTLAVAFEYSPTTVQYVSSTNGGVTWSNPVTLSSTENNPGASFSGTSSALMVGGTVIVAWTGISGSNFAVRFGSFAPNGAIVTLTNTNVVTVTRTVTSTPGVQYTTIITNSTVTTTTLVPG